MEKFETNDLVFITYGGRTVEGKVLFASGNGKSLMLVFDALLGGYVGAMPVLIDEARGEFLDIINAQTVTITKFENHVE